MTLGDQLAGELDRALAGPIGFTLSDLDLADAIRARIADRLPMLVGQLTGPDPHVAAETAIDLMAALWPHSDPTPEWWATPLGEAIAATAEGERTVSRSEAASILEVTTGTVAQLRSRGVLDGDRSGIPLRSVLTYRRQRRST